MPPDLTAHAQRSVGAPAQPPAARPLIVRLRNWVGDVVLGLPALQLLQAQGYQLHLVARGKWAPALLAGHSWPVHLQPKGLRARVAHLRALRAQCSAVDPGFDQRENALLLPVSFSSALEMKLAGLRAVGVAKEGRSLLLSRAEPWATQGHELERYFDIARRFVHQPAAPAPANIGLRVNAEKDRAAGDMLAALGVRGRFVMICPFAGGKAATLEKGDKRWPGFEAFAAQAEKRLGLPLLVYPGPGEEAAAREQYAAARVLEGGDLGHYAALLKRAALVVANDTGPGHMAGALGTPVISLMGSTEAARWAPWGPHVHVLQRAHRAPGAGDTDWPEADEALALAQRLLAESDG